MKDSDESRGDVYWPISFALCVEVNTLRILTLQGEWTAACFALPRWQEDVF